MAGKSFEGTQVLYELLHTQIEALEQKGMNPDLYKAVVHPSTFSQLRLAYGKQAATSFYVWGMRFEASVSVPKGLIHMVPMPVLPYAKKSVKPATGLLSSNLVTLPDGRWAQVKVDPANHRFTVVLGKKVGISLEFTHDTIEDLQARLDQFGELTQCSLTVLVTKSKVELEVVQLTPASSYTPPTPAGTKQEPEPPPRPKLTEFDLDLDLIEDRNW